MQKVEEAVEIDIQPSESSWQASTFASQTIAEEQVNGVQARLVLEVAFTADDAEEEMKAEGILEAYAEAMRVHINMGRRMYEAYSLLPEDVTPEEMASVLRIEKGVEDTFGEGSRLYGRAVALFAIRDLAGTL